MSSNEQKPVGPAQEKAHPVPELNQDKEEFMHWSDADDTLMDDIEDDDDPTDVNDVTDLDGGVAPGEISSVGPSAG